ncbi:DNA alkylation repair protein [Paenibacillus sp. N3/727]|uniref:DNA alkylation repair protein n=1 Tax=Paenibacillus sp. N3/727 TaxID=2925845 RepID=UPI001F535837|nr:DNA alkylation repair protein [Paenibacillus sp. N3/727]UNK18027.1 DNA alkylation repair protein [Paenibacillus sp. N3/727]
MRESLKDLFSTSFVESFAIKVKKKYPAFNTEQFKSLIHDEAWEDEEFKQRIRHITYALTGTLPTSYVEALDVLYEVAPECRGIEHLFIPDFVEVNGMADFERSMQALEFFTQFSTAEFAVRLFIIREQDKMIAQMTEWAQSDNEHVRRLASEGCRPRLPWGQQLPELIRDPGPVLPILTLLKEDKSLYVRKSVANHLNDISKDHPELVLDLAMKWYGNHPLTDWIVRHALRTLLRRGDVRALAIFGYEELEETMEVASLQVKRPVIAVGEDLEFSFTLINGSDQASSLRIDYEIGYMKANGKQAPKRYKCSDKMYAPGGHKVTKKQSFKVISTRRFYPGEHSLDILVNGKRMASVSFVLEE